MNKHFFTPYINISRRFRTFAPKFEHNGYRIIDYVDCRRSGILCAMGDDYYYCYGHKHKRPLAYSDYNMGDKPRATEFGERAYNECVGTAKEKLSREMAYYADQIVSVIYEYYAPYDIATDIGKDGRPIREKNHFIPLPIKMSEPVFPPPSEKLRVFLGYKLEFLDYKGADIMIKVAKDLLKKYPDKIRGDKVLVLDAILEPELYIMIGSNVRALEIVDEALKEVSGLLDLPNFKSVLLEFDNFGDGRSKVNWSDHRPTIIY